MEAFRGRLNGKCIHTSEKVRASEKMKVSSIIFFLDCDGDDDDDNGERERVREELSENEP